MTKNQLQKIKELDAFLKEKNIELWGDRIVISFNSNKERSFNSNKEFVTLNLDIGITDVSHIEELNNAPTIKNSYSISNGRIKQYK